MNRSVRPGVRTVSAVSHFTDTPSGTTVIVLEDGSAASLHFTVTEADGMTTVSLHGARGGTKGSFEVSTLSLADLAEAFRRNGLTGG